MSSTGAKVLSNSVDAGVAGVARSATVLRVFAAQQRQQARRPQDSDPVRHVPWNRPIIECATGWQAAG
jgi:hypothetical protein